jgi:hypothetical protein
MNDWHGFWRFCFGTPRRALITITIALVVVISGLLQLFVAGIIDIFMSMVSALLVIAFLLAIYRYIIPGGRGRRN